MGKNFYKADVDGIATLSGILSNLFQRTSISLGLSVEEWSGQNGLFEQYLNRTYPDQRTRYNVQTNLPRTLWDKDDLTWEMFLEGLATLNPQEIYLEVSLKRDISNEPITLTYPLHLNYQFPSKGKKITQSKTGSPSDPIWATHDDQTAVESFPALVVRDYLAETRLSWIELDIALERTVKQHLKHKQNTNETGLKSRLKTPILSPKLTWKKMIEVFETLQIDTANFTLKVVMNEKRKGQASLLWRF